MDRYFFLFSHILIIIFDIIFELFLEFFFIFDIKMYFVIHCA